MNPINAAMEGLARAEAKVERSAERIARVAPDGGADSVSLSGEMVELMVGQNAYIMNLRMVKAGAEMAKKLIDILA